MAPHLGANQSRQRPSHERDVPMGPSIAFSSCGSNARPPVWALDELRRRRLVDKRCDRTASTIRRSQMHGLYRAIGRAPDERNSERFRTGQLSFCANPHSQRATAAQTAWLTLWTNDCRRSPNVPPASQVDEMAPVATQAGRNPRAVADRRECIALPGSPPSGECIRLDRPGLSQSNSVNHFPPQTY